jgi:hypothetical protein
MINVRFSRLAAALAAGITAVVVMAGPASAAMSLSQSTNLVNGQAVTVSGTGTPNAPLNVYECAFPSGGLTMGQALDPSQCDGANVTPVTPDASGAYTTTFVFADPFTTTGGQGVDCSLQACEIVVDLVTPGDVTAFSMVTGNECDGFFMGANAQGFLKTTSADPATQVSVGQTITVTLNWSGSPQFPFTPTKVTDCVKVNGTVDTTLSQEDKTGPFPTNGIYTSFSYVVPNDVGQQICDRGAVGSAAVNTLKSNEVCYTIATGAILPESPVAILLPVSAAGLGLGGLILFRRRRPRSRPAT